MKFWTDMDWEERWMFLLYVMILAVVIGAATFVFAPKQVDGYYISSPQHRQGYCVYAHWTWHVDEVAFCSDDKDRVLDFAAKANASLKK